MSDKKMIDLEAAKKAIHEKCFQGADDGDNVAYEIERILESLAVPVEKGAISIIKKDDGYWLQLNGTHTSAVIKIESKSEIVMRSISEISELISLHRPVDREAVRKIIEGERESYDEIVDAIMELIGRSK